MSARLSSTGPPADFAAWQELEETLAELGALARETAPPHEFYRHALEQTVRALSAVGGAIWLRSKSGALQPIAQMNWRQGDVTNEESARRQHETVLRRAAENGRIGRAAAGTDGNPTEWDLFVAPVLVRREEPGTIVAPAALLEILTRPDVSPSVHRGYEQFLVAVVEIAAEYETLRELTRLRKNEAYRDQLLNLSRTIHRHTDLASTAYAIANDGRFVVGCDRLSVVQIIGGRHARLLAVSGAQHVDRRGAAARSIEKLATITAATNEPVYYADGQTDAFPEIGDSLERHAEATHARQILVAPVPTTSKQSVNVDEVDHSRQYKRPQFVLLAEQFDGHGDSLHRERLIELAEISATALANALANDQLPFGWLLRPLGRIKERATARLSRTVLLVLAAAAAIAALVFIPADFNIEATGTLQPVVRRAAFAPRSGIVDAVLVKHGQDVSAGQPLVRLRDPALDLERKRVHGDLETALRQIEAVRAARTSRAIRDTNVVETYRLSAEERELDQRIVNLRLELELLDDQAKQLIVTSPIVGRVLTWDVDHLLVARPVERGEVLVNVADVSANWQLELDVADDRIGHIFTAQQELGVQLPVRFRLSSTDRELVAAKGQLSEVYPTADVNSEPGASVTPTVRVNVAFDIAQFGEAERQELRPGVSARAEIGCGRRRLGYVWFRDVWDAAMSWARF